MELTGIDQEDDRLGTLDVTQGIDPDEYEEIEWAEPEECSTCEGSGVDPENETEDCPDCGGTGYQH
jgi:DnaJ-class molecular chaperone